MMPVPRPQTLSEAFIAYEQQKLTAPKELLGESEIIQAWQDLSPGNRKNLFKVLLCFLKCESFWAPNPTDTLVRRIYDAAIATLPGTPEERDRIINECRAHFPSALAEPLPEREFNVIIHRAVPITSGWRPSFTSPLTHGTPTYVPQAIEEDEEDFLSRFQQHMSASDHQSAPPSLATESYSVQALDPEQPLSLFARLPSEIVRTIFFMIPLDEENPIIRLRFVCRFCDAILKRLIPLGQEDELSLALMQKICREIPETSVIGNVRDIAQTIQVGAMPLPEPHAIYAGSRVIKQIWRYHNVARGLARRREDDPSNPQTFLQKTIQTLYPIPETATPEMRAEIEAFHAALLAEYHRRSYETTHRDARCLFFPPQSALAAGDNMDAVVDRLCGMLLRSDCQIEAIYILEQLTDENERALAQAIALSEKPIFVVGVSDYFYPERLPATYLKRLHASLALTHHDLPRLRDSTVYATLGNRPNGTKTITRLYFAAFNDQEADFLYAVLGNEECDIVKLSSECWNCDYTKLLILARAINASEARRGVQITLQDKNGNTWLNDYRHLVKLCDQRKLPIPDWKSIRSIKSESRQGQQVVTRVEFSSLKNDGHEVDFLCAALDNRECDIVELAIAGATRFDSSTFEEIKIPALDCDNTRILALARAMNASEARRKIPIVLQDDEGICLNEYRYLVKLCEQLKLPIPDWSNKISVELGDQQVVTRLNFSKLDKREVGFLCVVLSSEQCTIVNITIPENTYYDNSEILALARAINASEARRKVKITLQGTIGIRLNSYRHLVKLQDQLGQLIPRGHEIASIKLESKQEQSAVITRIEFNGLGTQAVSFLCAALSAKGVQIVLPGEIAAQPNSYHALETLYAQLAQLIGITGIELKNHRGRLVITGLNFSRLDSEENGFLCAALRSEQCDVVDITILDAIDLNRHDLLEAIKESEIRRGAQIILRGDGGVRLNGYRHLVKLCESLEDVSPPGWDGITSVTLENRRGQQIVTGVNFSKLDDKEIDFLCAALGSEQCAIVDITISAITDRIFIYGDFGSSALNGINDFILKLARTINASEARRGIQIALLGDAGVRLNGYRHLVKLCEQLGLPIPDWESEIPVKLENRQGQQVVTGVNFRRLGDQEIGFLCAALGSDQCAIVDITISFASDCSENAKQALARAINESETRRRISIVLQDYEGERLNAYRHLVKLCEQLSLPIPNWSSILSVDLENRQGQQVVTRLCFTDVGDHDVSFLCVFLSSEQCDIIDISIFDTISCNENNKRLLARAINENEARRGSQIYLRDRFNGYRHLVKLCDQLERPIPNWDNIAFVTLSNQQGQQTLITGIAFDRLNLPEINFLCAALHEEQCTIVDITISGTVDCSENAKQTLARTINKSEARRRVQIALRGDAGVRLNSYRHLVKLCEQLGLPIPDWESEIPVKLENRQGQQVVTGVNFRRLDDQEIGFLCAALDSEQCDIVDITISGTINCSEDKKKVLAGVINESEIRREVLIVLRGDEGVRLNAYRHLLKLCVQRKLPIPNWSNIASVTLRNQQDQQAIITGIAFNRLSVPEIDFLFTALRDEQCAIVDITISANDFSSSHRSRVFLSLARAINTSEARREVQIVLQGNEGVRLNGYRHLLKLCDQIKLPMPDWNSVTSVTLENRQGQQVVTGVNLSRLSDQEVGFLCAFLNSKQCVIADITISGAVDCSENAKQALARAINQNEVRRKTPIVLHGDGGGQIEACRQRPIGVDQHSAGSSGLFSQRGQPSGHDGTQVEKRPAGVLVV